MNMKAYVCLFAVLSIACVGVLGVAADFPQAREASRIAAALDEQKDAIFTRAEARNQIVDEVIAGRLKLPLAAEKFGALNRMAPEAMAGVRLTIAGDSEKECLCRQVILRVKAALEDHPSQAEIVLPRLESEMHDYLGERASGV
jgi:hypothetical protein